MSLFPYHISIYQNYALIFLAGSYCVAALSDLRRMAAQSDFAEVWVAAVAVLLSLDAYFLFAGELLPISFIVKWILILAFSSLALTIRLLSIAPMDVAAAAATAAALPPVSAGAYFIFLAVVGELLSPILKHFGSDDAYPYLPAVFVSSTIVVCMSLAGILP
ncbi:Uncharacterised protein [uncultured archaeon]|nr:Uncharacterised protein [uncultured archaeon]